MALHSTRPAAWADATANKIISKSSPKARQNLIMSQGLDGVELGGARCGIEARDQADDHGESQSACHQPQWHVPEVFRGHVLPTKINIRSDINAAADQPAQ